MTDINIKKLKCSAVPRFASHVKEYPRATPETWNGQNPDQIRKLGRLGIREAGLITELIISLVSVISFLVSPNFET